MIVSADKDLSQLLQANDEQYDFAKSVRWKADGVKARHGVHAHQIADYLALTGDAVDNIPGITGIGAKSAAILLAHFQSLDALLARIDEVPFLRLRGAAGMAIRLREQREHALLWRCLLYTSATAARARVARAGGWPFQQRRAGAGTAPRRCAPAARQATGNAQAGSPPTSRRCR